MPDLNLKNAEAYELAKRLSERTGESMTTSVTIALRERLERLEKDFDTEDVLAIAREIRERLPTGYLDEDFDEILFDEDGLPR